MERVINEEMVNELFTGEVELDLTVAYGSTHLKGDLEFAGFEVLVFNHSGEVIKLDVVDWKVGEGVHYNDGGEYLEGLGVANCDLKLTALVDISEENEVTAKMALQYMLNDLTVAKIDVSATATNGTDTPMQVDTFSFNVGSIEQ